MIFETHAHYDDEQFDLDREELLSSMPEQGVGTIVNVSATYESCRRVVDLVQKYPFMYAAVGIHPDEVGSLNEERFQQMKELCKQEKVVAVGEIGLDYYWDNESHDLQKEWFVRQLNLARVWKSCQKAVLSKRFKILHLTIYGLPSCGTQQNYLKKQAIRSFTLTQNILSGPEPAVLPLIFYPSI